MPLVQRFTTTTRGAMILAGNALNCRTGVSFPPYGNDYGNGSYISTNTALVAAAGFPPGTTYAAASSSSTAFVNIPSGSTILFAQLFWAIYAPVTVPGIDNAISLKTPTTTVNIAPDLALKQIATYVTFQAQDVKALIQSSGSGTYTVSSVPGLTANNGSTFIGNGWGLIIVYNNPSMPVRYFNVNTGVSLASAGSPSDFNFSGFQTSSVGIIKAYFLCSESNGDIIDGAQILVGTNLATSSKIGNPSTGSWDGTPPYAQINTMLPGNILNGDCNDASIGLLDTRGTFGTYNKDPFARTAPPYARTNMDILGVDISNKLLNNQTTLFTRVTYTGSGTGHVTSQSVQVDVNGIDFNPIVKSADIAYGDIGEVITYTITTTNMGNLTATNAKFIDTIPAGTTLVPNSAIINGVPQSSFNPSPPSGYSLGSIGPNAMTTIIYSVKVTTALPVTVNTVKNQGTITYQVVGSSSTQFQSAASNTVVTTISNVTLNSSKVVNKNYAKVGDVLTYTIPVMNQGNITATNILFIDTLPSDLTLVAGSVRQDGASISGDINPPGTILPGNIGPGRTSTITFNILVNTIPSPNPVVNSAALSTSYTIDPITTPNKTGKAAANTNAVATQINYATFSNIKKYTDKAFADCGETINYTIEIPNSGNVTAQNIIFKDTIPNGTTFVTNSVSINGTPQNGANPALGITIPNIGPGKAVIVTFSVVANC